METRRLVHPEHYPRLTGEELRKHFLVDDLFTEGEVKLVHWEGERTIIGSAVPLDAPLPLVSPEENQGRALLRLARAGCGESRLGRRHRDCGREGPRPRPP